jgi:CheY-like chemotaxis protein
LSNAAKYTPPGGRIEIVSETAGGDALVRVRDNGLGIPEDQLDGVFELFSQVPEHREHVNGRGLGIGLALSRQLIELHGGSVHASSAGLRSGSEFVIRLPLSPPAPRSALPARKTPAALAEPRRVLVVDDNIDAAQGLHLVLEMQGHTARVAYDGAEALRVLADFWPEIVLLDIALPELDGYEVARRIRALPGGAAVRLIALTGWGQPEDKQRALDAGFDAHLTKPLDMAALAQALTAGPRVAGSI